MEVHRTLDLDLDDIRELELIAEIEADEAEQARPRMDTGGADGF